MLKINGMIMVLWVINGGLISLYKFWEYLKKILKDGKFKVPLWFQVGICRILSTYQKDHPVQWRHWVSTKTHSWWVSWFLGRFAESNHHLYNSPFSRRRSLKRSKRLNSLSSNLSSRSCSLFWRIFHPFSSLWDMATKPSRIGTKGPMKKLQLSWMR